MGEMMKFPETVEEFMQQYKITDSQQIYTNGTELVPIFRMQQWFEAHKRRWIPCSERLPEPETEVLVVCRRGGVSFVCPAMYEDGEMLTGDSIWNWNEIEGYGLYNEDADDWFVPEGWWEYRQFNDDDVYNNPIDCAVTHWQPLPEPPEEGAPGNG